MTTLKARLEDRYQHPVAVPENIAASAALARMAGRGSCRHFAPRPVPLPLLRALSAIALSSPTKSDLQQRDIILVTDSDLLVEIKNLLTDQPWTAEIRSLAVFCGNNQRQRRLHEVTGLPFANDHLDAFFNATVDGAIALAAFITAAEEAGLACCPVSAIRNHPDDMDRILGLPDFVFPVAGLAVGWPEGERVVSQRLPLDVSLHENRFDSSDFDAALQEYNTKRRSRQPYAQQRRDIELGPCDSYGWSDDKARQYSQPERAGFGGYVLRKGFRLD